MAEPAFKIGQTVELRPETEQYRRGARKGVIRGYTDAGPLFYHVKLDKSIAGRAVWWLTEDKLKETTA